MWLIASVTVIEWIFNEHCGEMFIILLITEESIKPRVVLNFNSSPKKKKKLKFIRINNIRYFCFSPLKPINCLHQYRFMANECVDHVKRTFLCYSNGIFLALSINLMKICSFEFHNLNFDHHFKAPAMTNEHCYVIGITWKLPWR